MIGEYDEQVCMYQRIHMVLVNSEILSAIWSGGKFQFKSFNFWVPEIIQSRDFKAYGIITKQICSNKELPWWKHVDFLPGFLRWKSHNIKCITFKRTIRGISVSSVWFSGSVLSDPLRPHEPQHARPPCPSPTPGAYPNPCPSSRWCHPAISSSVVPFSSCPQSLQASGSFPMSQLFTWGGQNTGVSASVSVFPMNTQDWSPLRWTGWISKGLSRVFNTTLQKHQFFGGQLSSQSSSQIHTWPLEKP